MHHILSFLFEVKALKEQRLSRYSGLSVRSLLYGKILSSFLDAGDLHKYRGLKPVSVTPIYQVVGDEYKVLGYGDRFQHGFLGESPDD